MLNWLPVCSLSSGWGFQDGLEAMVVRVLVDTTRACNPHTLIRPSLENMSEQQVLSKSQNGLVQALKFCSWEHALQPPCAGLRWDAQVHDRTGSCTKPVATGAD